MDGSDYDAIIMGTGLTECLLSGLLSVNKYKVLHLDRNPYYGASCASVTLSTVFNKYKNMLNTKMETLGKDRDYNIDLVSKFLMANGKLMKMLRMCGVTKHHIEFTLVQGSYVLKGSKLHKVPASAPEALKSSLVGMFEKRKLQKFMMFATDFKPYDPNDQSTFKNKKYLDMNMAELFKSFKLKPNTIDFLGHAVALYPSEEYLTKQTATQGLKKIGLYTTSFSRYGTSPYIYPLYGLGELPQVFSRFCAVHGGTFMLAQSVDGVEYDDNTGVVNKVTNGDDQYATCKFVVADPSYFPKKVKKVGEVVRAICILNHPVPNTADAPSVQIILPQKQTGRKHDCYVTVTSYQHKVAKKGYYLALISTTVETGDPEKELIPVFKLLGNISAQFIYTTPVHQILDDGSKSKVFISKDYDASTHFEGVCADILDMFKRITGKDLDLEKDFVQAED